MNEIKNICVYSSSSDNISESYKSLTRELGKRIAKLFGTLIYGGGNVGLMGIIASSVSKFGGKVIGIIPEEMRGYGIEYFEADELIYTIDMKERKALMEEKAEAFIALPGGFGTLEEVFQVITLKQLGYHKKPIVFLNFNNFYDKLIEFFEKLFQEKFAKKVFNNLYYLTDDIDDALDYIKNYQEEKIPKKWF